MNYRTNEVNCGIFTSCNTHYDNENECKAQTAHKYDAEQKKPD